MHAGGHRFDPGILHQLDTKTELRALGFRIELVRRSLQGRRWAGNSISSLKTEYLATIVIRVQNKCAVRRTVSLLELRLE